MRNDIIIDEIMRFGFADFISWNRCGSPSNECEKVFLSGKHVCDWFGITCHENNDVKRISLRKLSPCLVILSYIYSSIISNHAQ